MPNTEPRLHTSAHPNRLSRLLAYMGFPVTGKAGRRNLLVFGGIYAFCLLMIVLAGDDIADELVWITLAFPFVLMAGIVVLAGIRCFFTLCYRKLPRAAFVALCGVALLVWSGLAACGFLYARECHDEVLGLSPHVVWILCDAALMGAINLMVLLSLWNGIWSARTVREQLRHLPLHLLLYVPMVLFWVFGHGPESILGATRYGQALLLFLSLHYALYCLMSFSMWYVVAMGLLLNPLFSTRPGVKKKR